MLDNKQIRLVDNEGKRYDIMKHREQYECIRSAVLVKTHNMLKEMSISVPQVISKITSGKTKDGETYNTLMSTEMLQNESTNLTEAIVDRKKTSGTLSDCIVISDGVLIRNIVTFQSDGKTIYIKSTDSMGLSNKLVQNELKTIGCEHTFTLLVDDLKTSMLSHQLYVNVLTRIKDLAIQGASENLRMFRMTSPDYRYLKYQYILSDCIANSNKPLVITSNKQSIIFNEVMPNGAQEKRFTLTQLIDMVHKKTKSKVSKADITEFICCG